MYWRVIDALQDKEAVHKDITDQVEALMNEYNRPGDDMMKNYYPYSIGLDLFKVENI